MTDPAAIQYRTVFWGNPVSLRRGDVRWGWLVVFCFAQIPLALAINLIESLATAHAIATVAVGLWWAFSERGSPVRTAYTAAYIAGAEVMWRMTEASVFWELGKYAVAAIFLVALLRKGRYKGILGPGLYFSLLLPSALLTMQVLGWSDARDAFSFNLTGPFALFVCGWFFSNVTLTVKQLQRLLLILAAPVVGTASVAQYVFQTSEYVRFSGTSSNFATSGGFGPNQVSAILGLGALAGFLVLVIGRLPWYPKLVVVLVMLGLAAQSALTFSRGGLYNAVGAIALTSIYLLRHRRLRAKFLVLILIASATAYFVILPALNDVTGGALSARFTNTATTNRLDIAEAQIQTWLDHPLLGVGPGLGRFYAGQLAHTEVTRLLAEHGVFGFLALVMLGWMALRNINRARVPINKVIAIAAVGWSLLFMLNAGMRLVAPGLAFGLSFLCLVPPRKLRGPHSRNLRRGPPNPLPERPALFVSQRTPRANGFGVRPDSGDGMTADAFPEACK
jgi:O-Antigen ligase